VAVNDLVVHPRENDLVLGTHGRGVWILDDVTAIQELTPDVMASEAHLFTPGTAEQIRYESETGHTGDMVFRGQNPPRGAVIDYWLGGAVSADSLELTVLDADGNVIREVEADTARGVNRVTWDLRHERLRSAAPDDAPAWQRQGPGGPLVVPGDYTVRLTVNGESQERSLEVREDPRVDLDGEARRAWTATLHEIASLHDSVAARVKELNELVEDRPNPADEDPFRGSGDEEARERWAALETQEHREIAWQAAELLDRIGGLYWRVSSWTGEPTADQTSRLEFYREMAAELAPAVREVVEEESAGAEER
jgi:hypothetical protein